MPYCAPCRVEYEEGVEKCTDCGEILVAGSMPEGAGARPAGDEWTMLMRVRGEETAEIIHGLLTSEGIENEIVGKRAAELPMPAVESMSRLEIWVPKPRVEEARALLNETREGTAPCPACGHMSAVEEIFCEYCDARLR